MLAVPNPGSTSDPSRCRGLRFRLPLRATGSATPITFDFGAMFPFTVVPAYHLPVYASQPPLPVATQDSVRGCSLGFAAAVIADGRLQRACKAQRSSNRTGPMNASGSPTGFTARYTESKLTTRGFGTVSNSPSPLDTAISGGACH